MEKGAAMTEPHSHQPPSLNHYCFAMEPHDFQFVIEVLKPLLKNPHCGDLARSLIIAMERAQQGKIFHIFAETHDDKLLPARSLHNDPNFKMDEL